MKRITVALSLLVFAVAVSCTSTPTRNEAEASIYITLDPSKQEKVLLSSIIDSSYLVKLETTEDNLISRIEKIYRIDDKYIVYDSKSNQIFIFDTTGKYLNKISKIGRGPGEYVVINSMMFDSANQTIIVYDGAAFKMLFYSLDGELKKEVTGFQEGKIKREVFNLPDGNFLCYSFDLPTKETGVEGSGLWEVDGSGKYLRTIFNCDEIYPLVHGSGYFTPLSDGRVMLRDAMTGDLSYYKEGTLEKFISYRIKGNEVLTKYKGQSYNPEVAFTWCAGVYPKGDKIISQWVAGEDFKNFCAIYSIAEDRHTLTRINDFWSDDEFINGGFVEFNDPEVLCLTTDGSWLEKLYNEGSPKLQEKIRNVTSGMSEDEILNMNPVLQFLHVKQ